MPSPSDLMFANDPAQAALYAKLFGSNSQSPANPNALVNQQIVDAQNTPPVQNPSFDPATLAQPQPPPSRSLASMGATNAVEGRQAKTRSEENIYDLLNQVGNNPAFKSQQDALSDYEKQVKDYINKKPGIQNLDLSPLMALSDAWNPGSHMAASYQAPESAQEHQLRAMQLGAGLEQRQGDVAKTQEDLLKDKLNALVGIDKSNREMAPAMMMMQDRMDNLNHQKTLMAVKSDPVIRNLYSDSRKIANGLSALDEAKQAPPQQFDELQQGIRANLGIMGKSGVDERSKTMFNSMGIDSDRAQQYLFGTPSDVRETAPEFIDHLKNLVQIVQRNNMTQMQAHLQSKMAGNASMYVRRPDLASDLQGLGQATTNQFLPQNMAPGASGNLATGGNAFQPSPQPQASGGQDPKISNWAKQYGYNYDQAATILKARGYGK